MKLKKILSGLIVFMVETLVSYLFALMWLIPVWNVYMLRTFIKDSKAMSKKFKKKRCKK